MSCTVFHSVKQAMNTTGEQRRYRAVMARKGLQSYEVRHLETDLHVQTEQDLSRECSAWIIEARLSIENYARSHQGFMDSYSPLPPDPLAPPVVLQMLEASSRAGTGPMAAVAGAIAEYVGSRCARKSAGDVIVENGGDIFIRASGKVIVSLWAGQSPLSGHVGIELECRESHIGVCTSSGTVGHSKSFGRADAVSVISPSVALADATATAVGNTIATARDMEHGLQAMKNMPDITGGVIVVGDKIGAWGDIQLVPI